MGEKNQCIKTLPSKKFLDKDSTRQIITTVIYWSPLHFRNCAYGFAHIWNSMIYRLLSSLMYEKLELSRLNNFAQTSFCAPDLFGSKSCAFCDYFKPFPLNLFSIRRDEMKHMTSWKQALQANDYRCGSINTLISKSLWFWPLCVWLQVFQIFRNHQGHYFNLLTNQPSLLGLMRKEPNAPWPYSATGQRVESFSNYFNHYSI